MATAQVMRCLPVAAFASSPCSASKLPLPCLQLLASAGKQAMLPAPQGILTCLSPRKYKTPANLGVTSKSGKICSKNSSKHRRCTTPEELSRCKRKLNFASMTSGSSSKTRLMALRNERDRKRVTKINHGLAALKDCAPQGGKIKTFLRAESLRTTTNYIQQLQQLVEVRNSPKLANKTKDISCVLSPTSTTQSVQDPTSPGDYSTASYSRSEVFSPDHLSETSMDSDN